MVRHRRTRPAPRLTPLRGRGNPCRRARQLAAPCGGQRRVDEGLAVLQVEAQLRRTVAQRQRRQTPQACGVTRLRRYVGLRRGRRAGCDRRADKGAGACRRRSHLFGAQHLVGGENRVARQPKLGSQSARCRQTRAVLQLAVQDRALERARELRVARAVAVEFEVKHGTGSKSGPRKRARNGPCGYRSDWLFCRREC